MPITQTLNYLEFVDLPDHHFVTLFINDNVAQQRFDISHYGCGPRDFRRHVSVAYDEMHTKGRFAVNHSTNELVGVSSDAFECSVIAMEFNQLTSSTDSTNGSEKISVPEHTKHFLAFIATTISAEMPNQHIVIVRYNVKKTNMTSWPAALWKY